MFVRALYLFNSESIQFFSSFVLHFIVALWSLIYLLYLNVTINYTSSFIVEWVPKCTYTLVAIWVNTEYDDIIAIVNIDFFFLRHFFLYAIFCLSFKISKWHYPFSIFDLLMLRSQVSNLFIYKKKTYFYSLFFFLCCDLNKYRRCIWRCGRWCSITVWLQTRRRNRRWFRWTWLDLWSWSSSHRSNIWIFEPCRWQNHRCR